MDRGGRDAQVRQAPGKLHEERHGAPGGLHLAVFRQPPLREGISPHVVALLLQNDRPPVLVPGNACFGDSDAVVGQIGHDLLPGQVLIVLALLGLEQHIAQQDDIQGGQEEDHRQL